MTNSLLFKKTRIYLLLFVAALGAGTARAQVTTLVDPGENTIAAAVAAASANDTLVLARGEEYTLTEAVPVDKPLFFRSSPGLATDKPAVIFFTSTTGEGGTLFNVGASCTFSDLGMLGKTTEDKPVLSFNFTVPEIEVTADGCIFMDNHELFNTGGKATFNVKNSKLFNFTWSLYDGWVGQMGGWDSDSVHLNFTNNTVFVMNRYFNYSTTKYGGSTLADHNTIVNTFNNTLFPSPDKELVIKNNIFYNTFYRGYVGDRTFYAGTDSAVTTSDASSNELASRPYIPASDTLNGDISIIINPADSTSGRVVAITNNMKFTEQAIRDFQAENGVTIQPLINETAKDVLAPEFGWTISDNLDGDAGIDPGFAMGELPEAAYTYGFQARLDRISPQNDPWHEISYRPDGALVGEFIWPLPFDFTPTVDTRNLSSDGYPLGDLNWYGKEIVKMWENHESFPTGSRNLINADLGLKIYGDRISYVTPRSDKVSLKIYSIVGIEVASLVNQVQGAGSQTATLPEKLGNGIYICKLQVGSSIQSQKVVVSK